MSFQRETDFRGPPPNPLGFPPSFNPMFMPPGFPPLNLMTPPPEISPKRELVTPIFVGNISDRCSNEFLQRILGECGRLRSWKRIQGSHSKPQAFGFCEFEEPEGTLRALRILKMFQLGDKHLVVKVEDKLHAELCEWAAKKRKEEGKEALVVEEGELPADEADRKEDDEARKRIVEWMKTDFPEIPVELVREETKKKREKEKEIRKEKEREDRKEKRSRRERSSSRRRRDRSSSRRRRRSRSSNSRSGRSPSRCSSKRKHDSDSDSSDSDYPEQVRKEIRLKERRYRDRVRKWEKREEERVRFYEKEKQAEKDERVETEIEAQKLLRFLEDYNDAVDDEKFFKGDRWARRKKTIARVLAEDLRDRLDEAAELEEHRKALEKAMIEVSEDESVSPEEVKKEVEEEASETEEEIAAVAAVGVVSNFPVQPETWTAAEIKTESPSTSSAVAKPPPTVLPVIVPKDNLQARVHQVFGTQDDEDEMDHLRTRKHLKPFEITAEDRRQVMTEQERKQLSQRLIRNIPTKKEELFAFAMDWTKLDAKLLSGRVKPWVSKKITEYIGEREDSLVDFICDKVTEHKGAEEIFADIHQILDEDAETFVIKLWRLLVFETEARKLGISK